MTISTTNSFSKSVADGIEKTFNFDFQVNGAEDVQVYFGSVVQSTAGFAVSVEPDNVGGSVTFVEAPPSGTLVTCRRWLEASQTTAYPVAGPFPAKSHERALDKLTMLVQQTQDLTNNAVTSTVWRGDWQEDYAYNEMDLVWAPDGRWYACSLPHTSGTTFADDLAAGRWILALDVAYIDQRASDASAAAIEAKASEDAAALSETNAAASASSASTSAGTAATQAGIATTQAGIATTKASEAAASAAEAASLVIVGERSDAIYPDYYVATAGQEDFTITHPAPKENILVFMNSRKLRITDDYTLDSDIAASTLTLTTAAEGGEEVDIISINTYDLTGSAEDMQDLVDEATAQAGTATTQAGIATTQAGIATTQAGNAATSAGTASTQAGIATTQAGNAATSASTASTQAGTATTQAGIATTQAGISTTKAGEAAASAELAEDWADAAAASAVVAEGHADDAAVSATEAEAATALLQKKIQVLQNELISCCIPAVDKILATTANLVDVFVYNTYKDYDGGLWTENANYQSWYIEQLNTATRGSKREFPKVALIVAETNKVTIYDATETDCPMWMVITASSGGTKQLRSAAQVRAVFALNGVLCVSAELGLSVFRFNEDRASVYASAGIYQWANSAIVFRDSAGGLGTASGTGIVNTTVNDVAMTQISRTENSFGLLDPVIAAFTDGGVSVIDGPAGVGTVVDMTYTRSSSNQATSGFFTSGGGIGFLSRLVGAGYTYLHIYNTIPSADTTAAPDRYYANFNFPATSPNLYLNGDLAVGTYEKVAIDGAVGSNANGVTKLSEDTATPANGMVAYLTNSYNTGWLKGDIRRAVICEAEGTTETLTNLVTNGTFDTDTSWKKGTGWTISGGTLNHTANSSYATQEGVLTIGETYTITYTINSISGNTVLVYCGGGTAGTARSAAGTYSETLTCSGNTDLSFFANSTAVLSIDNVIVTKATKDRSVKASSLTVNGSLTRSPVATGAELQAVSGFSAANYSSQAYSADLDFGTGDFYICGWLKENPNSAIECIFERAYHNGSSYIGAGIFAFVSATGYLNFRITDDAYATYDTITSSQVVDTSTPAFAVLQKVSGKLELWLNGVKAASDVTVTAAINSLSNASGTFAVGRSVTSSYPLTNGSLALLRIGAGSLSDDQIAKMYREELALFQPGAKCTIQGASSAVTALAYNERYNKLLVGTSAGVTCFDNLAVDENFYTNTGSIKALASDNKIKLAASTAEVKVKK